MNEIWASVYHPKTEYTERVRLGVEATEGLLAVFQKGEIGSFFFIDPYHARVFAKALEAAADAYERGEAE